MTVTAGVDGRFDRVYPGFGVEVLDGSGRQVDGKTLLKTVRATLLTSSPMPEDGGLEPHA